MKESNDTKEPTIQHLSDFVVKGLQNLRRGDYFTEFGLKESDTLLEKDMMLPQESAKLRPFNKFLKAVAADIVKDRKIESNKKHSRKSFQKLLQLHRERWLDIIVDENKNGTTDPQNGISAESPAGANGHGNGKSGEADINVNVNVAVKEEATSPELGNTTTKRRKKPKKRKASDVMTEHEENHKAEAHSTQENGVGSASTSAKRQKPMQKSEEHLDEESAKILADIPQEYKNRFGQIGFAKWGKDILPVLVFHPFKVPHEDCRKLWLDMYRKTKKTHRQEHMSILVYWYGSMPAPQYSLVVKGQFLTYEQAAKKGLTTIPSKLQKKIAEGKKLQSKEENLILGLEEMKADMDKHPDERHGHLLDLWETDLLDDQADPPIGADFDDKVVVKEEEDAKPVSQPPISEKAAKPKKSRKSTPTRNPQKLTKKKDTPKSKPAVTNTTTEATVVPTAAAVTPAVAANGDAEDTIALKPDSKPEARVKEETPAPRIDNIDLEALGDTEESITSSEDEADGDYEDSPAKKVGKGKQKEEEEMLETDELPKFKKKAKPKAKTPKAAASSAKATKAKPDKTVKPAKKKVASKHKIDRVKTKKGVTRTSAKVEQEMFEACEDKFLAQLLRWRSSEDPDEITEILTFFGERVDELSVPFILKYDLARIVKDTKRALMTDLSIKVLADMKRAYAEKIRFVPEHFDPKVRPHQHTGAETQSATMPYPAIAPAIDAVSIEVKQEDLPKAVKAKSVIRDASEQADKQSSPPLPAAAAAAVSIKVEQTVEVSKPPPPAKRAAKPERKRFSLQNLVRPDSQSRKEQPERESKGGSRIPPNTPVVRATPSWMIEPSPLPKLDDETRSFALEFLQQGLALLPIKQEIGLNSIAMELENCIHVQCHKMNQSRSDKYWETMHAAVALISEVEDKKGLGMSLLGGNFSSPKAVIDRVLREMDQ